LIMNSDRRYPKQVITCWCYATDPEEKLTVGTPVPCKKEACGRYRAAYPYCIQMERRDQRGFVVPE